MPRLNEFIFQILRALRISWKASPSWSTANLGLIAAISLVPLGQIALIKLTIDRLVLSATDGGRDFFSSPLPLYLLAMLALFIIGDALSCLFAYVQYRIHQITTDHIDDRIHQKSLSISYDYYEKPEYFDTLHLAQVETGDRLGYLVGEISQAGKSLLTLTGLLAFVLIQHPFITLILVLSVIPGTWIHMKISRKYFYERVDWTADERKIEYLSSLMTRAFPAKEIRIFNLGDYLTDKFSKLRAHLRQRENAIEKLNQKANFAIHASTSLSLMLAFVFLVYQTLRGALSVGSLVMYHQAFSRIQSSMRMLSRSLAHINENRLFLSHFFGFLDLTETTDKSSEPKTPSGKDVSVLNVEGLRFRYPGSDRDVIDGLGFEIPRGECHALIGENGSGKSTLLKLLCSMYSGYAGHIRLDDRELTEFDRHQISTLISSLFQDHVKYALTLRENIGFGDLDEIDNERALRDAAESSTLNDVIAKFPEGMDQLLGKEYAKGTELSIGQWQKLALARALIGRAPVLILDEPTAHLDEGSTKGFMDAILEGAKNRITLIASHDKSVIERCHRVLKLREGQIV